MALTESSMVSLGTPLPNFRLPDTDGTYYSSDDFSDRPLLVMFICNHCPYVKHIAAELSLLSRDFAQARLGMVAIQSNDIEGYPEDRPELMLVEKETRDYRFPYLFDESQKVAREFQATCTPDFFLFDANRQLAYRGQFDASRPKNSEPVSGIDLRNAADAVLRGDAVSGEQIPSIGCNIKWKAGQEPDYFPT